MRYDYKLDENIFEYWFKELYSPLIRIKIKLIYYNKSKTSKLVINKYTSSSVGILQNNLCYISI